MFKIVVACAFSQTYTVKVHLFWLQNFHIFLKFKCSSWKWLRSKPKKRLWPKNPNSLYVTHWYWSFNFSNTVKFFKAEKMKEYYSYPYTNHQDSTLTFYYICIFTHPSTHHPIMGCFPKLAAAPSLWITSELFGIRIIN